MLLANRTRHNGPPPEFKLPDSVYSMFEREDKQRWREMSDTAKRTVVAHLRDDAKQSATDQSFNAISIYSKLRKVWQGKTNRISIFIFVVAIWSGIDMFLQSRKLREAWRTPDGFDLPNEPKKRQPIPRLINDATIEWNETMHRPWLEASTSGSTINQDQPPYMILLTDWGWNHPNQTYGLTLLRSYRERELFTAIVNHPYFHPTAWEDIRNGSLPISANVNYYVFADISQCIDYHYPKYGKIFEDFDGFYNRTVPQEFGFSFCMKNPEKFGFLEHPLFQNTTTVRNSAQNDQTATATLVNIACIDEMGDCPTKYDNDHISIAAKGAAFSDIVLDRDQGLIPPALNPIRLSKEEEYEIATCKEDRPLNVTYIGNFRNGVNSPFHMHHGVDGMDAGARLAYEPLNEPSEGIVIMEKHDLDQLDSIVSTNNKTLLENPTYHSLLRSTKFALAPRGDCKYSYRFTEVLSAGAIPVFHADNFVLPFRPELVDWNKCALVLPEKDAGAKTLKLIEDMMNQPDAKSKLCAMRKYCYFEIYKKYIVTPRKQIDGIIEGLEARTRSEPKEHVGLVCNETNVKNFECNPR